MKIQKGIVQYKDRNDIECLYGTTEDGRAYYFLDATDTRKLANGNRIASTQLVEAIDPMVKASNVGLVNDEGVEVIPFNNRAIRPISDNAILVEPANPISESVIEANNLRTDPLAATQLVSTPAVIKEKINAQMGGNGRYIFNDQFSEATVCDIEGNNKLNNEYYSFIGMNEDKLYLAKNKQDTDIKEFSLSTMEYVSVENNISEETVETPVEQVTNEEVPQEVVENEVSNVEEPIVEETPVENVNQGFDMNEVDAVPLEESQIVENPIPEVNTEEVGEEIKVPTGEDTPVENIVEEAPVEDVQEESELENTIPAFDFGIDETPVEKSTPVEEDIKEESIDEDYTMEDSELDSMVQYGEDEEDRFKDYSSVETDKIDYDYTEKDFDDTEVYRDDSKGKARVITGLINVVKVTKNENNKLRSDLKSESEKSRMKDEKIDILTAQSRSDKAKINKLENRNEMLEDEIRESKRRIDSLEREISSLRQGDNELNRVIQEAEALIDDDRDYTNEDLYYSRMR